MRKVVKYKKQFLLGVVVAVVIFVVGVVVLSGKEEERISSFEECITAGHFVMESYPRQCRDGEGNVFIEEIEYPLNPEG